MTDKKSTNVQQNNRYLEMAARLKQMKADGTTKRHFDEMMANIKSHLAERERQSTAIREILDAALHFRMAYFICSGPRLAGISGRAYKELDAICTKYHQDLIDMGIDPFGPKMKAQKEDDHAGS